ncbi:uncharacterized protein LOC109856931 isoform X2 [Pseudomyrmex gracilis]|uniref:uncharacterized protein LOC109856931 isoform X2 n=1 Tax=Pseudomyrmex gracilis TaxID=219809 RepID=UPI000995A640|nr:uncharacterized protein LOC109856931 isoform X2 [Pseudomyrmex gracilis]
MENQGYEKDHSRVKDSDSDLARNSTHPEGHVYEDISTDTTTNIPDSSERISFLDESRNNNNDRRSAESARQDWINESSNDKSYQRSSTELSSPTISTNRESANSTSQTEFRTNENENSENSCGKSCDHPATSLPENVSTEGVSSQKNEDLLRDNTLMQSDRKRRRRKKDCKHCRNKLTDASSCEKLDESSKDAILRDNENNHREKDSSGFLLRESLLKPQSIKVYPMTDRMSLREISAKSSSNAFFVTETNSGPRSTENDFLMNAENNRNKLLGTDMRINSIYSQDRCHAKDLPIFYTDIKDQNPFQRAYSLPVRTHTPTSQNRVNLRRSARNDPPPHPARLDKHRRGWTLHLARPLKASGCSSSLIPLLVVVLILLGVAGVALYIVFEPEKLQIIQQYLKSSSSSSSRSTRQNITSGEPITIPPVITVNEKPNPMIETTLSTTTMTTVSADVFVVSALVHEPSFPASSASPTTGAETEAASQKVVNATRYCDDCLGGEVCVALVDEEVPICRNTRDSRDPTGCGGLCVINKQKCHRLDVDAFKCVEINHCQDNEWTCTNSMCLPLEYRCDGKMNCHDRSDEYNCACNLETHFRCGNETSCLPLNLRCNGKVDCWDASDEINCTIACPLENQFTCGNGECILKERFCDALADCNDGSDEPQGCNGRCSKHEFKCQNGRCISKRVKCNKIDDCGDGSDETYCKYRF